MATRSFSSHKAQLVARAAVAAKQGGFIKMNDAVFKVSRFKKTGGNVTFTKKMIYNLKHQSVQINNPDPRVGVLKPFVE